MPLICPQCDHDEFLTYDTRQRSDGISRKRECKNCGHDFRTVEISQREYKFLTEKLALFHESLAGLANALHEATP